MSVLSLVEEAENSPVKYDQVTALVSAYDGVVKGFKEIQGRIDQLEAFSLQAGVSLYLEFPGRNRDDLRQIKLKYWNKLFEVYGAIVLLAPSKRRALDDWLRSNDLPEFTEDNVLAQLRGFGQNAHSMFEAYAKEVFERLRPSLHNKHKTNEKNRVAIKDKVIFNYGIQYGRINSYLEPFITALDNLMHILDGKQVDTTDRTKSFEWRLNQALLEARKVGAWLADTSQGYYEDEYFKVKWFKKGTIHLEFKRPDLVEQFNKWAGNQYEIG